MTISIDTDGTAPSSRRRRPTNPLHDAAAVLTSKAAGVTARELATAIHTSVPTARWWLDDEVRAGHAVARGPKGQPGYSAVLPGPGGAADLVRLERLRRELDAGVEEGSLTPMRALVVLLQMEAACGDDVELRALVHAWRVELATEFDL